MIILRNTVFLNNVSHQDLSSENIRRNLFNDNPFNYLIKVGINIPSNYYTCLMIYTIRN